MPIAIAIASILNTFTLVWILTYITNVSIIVQFLIALVGLGVAIDYALLMIFRFRDELRDGEDVETALVETMTHAGRSVIVSGSTVAVGLLSMVILPLPFIRSIGIGGMLIPAVSVIAAITLLPAMLALLGTRINSVRAAAEAARRGQRTSGGRLLGPVGQLRHAAAVAGRDRRASSIVGALATSGPAAQPERGAGEGLARQRRRDRRPGPLLAGAGISPGVMKPFVDPRRGRRQQSAHDRAPSVAATPGVDGAVGAARSGAKGDALVEAIPSHDGAASSTKHTISTLQHDVRCGRSTGDRRRRSVASRPRTATSSTPSTGTSPTSSLFVILLTYLLLARAFRSLVLALKAVILNLVSLGAAYGIIVFIFQ